MTTWDLRIFLRAFAAAILGILVVWLVTAASDEGQLTVGVRAGRTLPIAPLASAVGAALALGTNRVRAEVRALEALGRSPSAIARSAAFGAATPSVLVALAIVASSAIDVSGFYPRPPRGDAFSYEGGTFTSPTLGVSVGADGEPKPVEIVQRPADEGLPSGARPAAAAATAIAGVALALVSARAILRVSMLDRRARRQRRAIAIVLVFGCALLTVVAFQAAAAHLVSPLLAIAPPMTLLAIALFLYVPRGELTA
ncbi:MAG: hypothetical protein JST00_34370 [Deltaproteobacteria bacterium]|nr:hypothetical protein [Deltaproteobacteria bacterium]